MKINIMIFKFKYKYSCSDTAFKARLLLVLLPLTDGKGFTLDLRYEMALTSGKFSKKKGSKSKKA